jgi:hypothetical protein
MNLCRSIATAIIRQVVRAAQAQYRAFCGAYGTQMRCGSMGWLFPSPETVLGLGDAQFAAVGLPSSAARCAQPQRLSWSTGPHGRPCPPSSWSPDSASGVSATMVAIAWRTISSGDGGFPSRPCSSTHSAASLVR